MATRKVRVGEVVGHYKAQTGCGDNRGSHMCAEHPDADTHNNLAMNAHVEEPGDHIEVWDCPVHGPEVP